MRAALLSGPAAIDAWRVWRELVDLERLDPGSYRLVPLLCHNLKTQGIEHPDMKLLAEVHRYTWLRNRVIVNQLATVLRLFQSAGIKTMVLKGAPLSLLHYPECALRPMDDFDVLVPTSQSAAAIEVLRDSGWTPLEPENLKPHALAVRHSQEFRNPDGLQCDLHWHVLRECLQEDADDDFWSDAVPLDIQGVGTLALNPADQLLHVCSHGLKWDPVPPIRWIADGAMILRHSGGVDWERLIGQVRKRRLILPVRNALDYLRDLLGACVPDSVLDRFHALPVSRGEEADYLAKLQPIERAGSLGKLWIHYRCALRAGRNASLPARILGFLRYLQFLWQIDHLWQVPFHVLFRAVRRLGKLVLGRK